MAILGRPLNKRLQDVRCVKSTPLGFGAVRCVVGTADANQPGASGLKNARRKNEKMCYSFCGAQDIIFVYQSIPIDNFLTQNYFRHAKINS